MVEKWGIPLGGSVGEPLEEAGKRTNELGEVGADVSSPRTTSEARTARQAHTQLAEMGFTNSSLNTRLLAKHSGNLAAVIEALTVNDGNDAELADSPGAAPRDEGDAELANQASAAEKPGETGEGTAQGPEVQPAKGNSITIGALMEKHEELEIKMVTAPMETLCEARKKGVVRCHVTPSQPTCQRYRVCTAILTTHPTPSTARCKGHKEKLQQGRKIGN